MSDRLDDEGKKEAARDHDEWVAAVERRALRQALMVGVAATVVVGVGFYGGGLLVGVPNLGLSVSIALGSGFACGLQASRKITNEAFPDERRDDEPM